MKSSFAVYYFTYLVNCLFVCKINRCVGLRVLWQKMKLCTFLNHCAHPFLTSPPTKSAIFFFWTFYWRLTHWFDLIWFDSCWSHLTIVVHVFYQSYIQMELIYTAKYSIFKIQFNYCQTICSTKTENDGFNTNSNY